MTNVFDTQVGAGFLGFGNQEGYESLVNRVLGVKLRGGEGFTRWDKRPLTDQRIAYAADDARSLLALGSAIEGELVRAGAGWSGRERSAGWWRRQSTCARRERAYERLPNSAGWTTRAVRWRAALCAWREGHRARGWTARPPS